MCHLLPHSGEGLKEIQKQVQDDINISLKRTYSPTHLFTYSPRKRLAFTLAEVLITLGIIGVVAAMTMPSIIADYQKKQTAVKLKQTYSILQQGAKLSEIDNGPVSDWDTSLSNELYYQRYIKPYYKIIKEYDKGSFPSDYHALCKSVKYECDYYAHVSASDTIRFIIENGTLLFLNDNDVTRLIVTDINGLKGPNIWGKDIFIFSYQNNQVIPYGLDVIYSLSPDFKADKDYLLNGESRSCQRDGVFCAAIMMLDGREITDEYKW